MVARVPGRLGELVDRDLGRRDVRVAEAEVDDVHVGSPGRHLQRVDLGECVRRERMNAPEFHPVKGSPGRLPATATKPTPFKWQAGRKARSSHLRRG